jgi:glycosyltransferase involved in cell wall biosynthesis
MIKVAHISTVDVGLRYLLLNQMRTLREAGYEVYGISAPGDEVETIRAAGVRYIPVLMSRRFSLWGDLRAFWQLYRTMRRERFTIVHTHTPKAALLGQYAALLARVPVRVHTIHGLYFPGHMNPSRRWVYVMLERLTMLFSHLNLSQNPEDIPVAIQERICAEERIRLLGNGIDVSAFDPALKPPEKRSAMRASLGIRDDHKVVGMVARFVAEKGYLEMLEAAQIVRQAEPDARFVFVGGVEPEKKDGLDPSVIGQMGLDDVVHFLGHRRDIADLYAIMDVLALPSHREGFPRAPMEAAAAGVPAVVTNIRGCRQVVDDGETGHIVPLRDPPALADALLDLLRDDGKRRQFAASARRKALAEFDENVVFGRIVAAYDELLRQRLPQAETVLSTGRLE